MDTVFKNHLVICNWNRRGKTIVKALKALSDKPIVIVCEEIAVPVGEVGNLDNVFILAGNPTLESSLLEADVAYAQSVLVLAAEQLGASADAQSVKIALLVENIQVTVYTVVELLDLSNKPHFSWTKVDDLITDQELAIRLFSQGVRHLALDANSAASLSAMRMLEVYQQLVNPLQDQAQLFRISVPWGKASSLCFIDLLKKGLSLKVLPCALVGFTKHEIASTEDESTWTSWKTDILSNPTGTSPIQSFWPEWPDKDFELGIIVFGSSYKNALLYQKSLS